MASMIRPICVPSMFLDNPSARGDDSSLVAVEEAESMLFSKRRYKRPTEAIRKPPSNLRETLAP